MRRSQTPMAIPSCLQVDSAHKFEGPRRLSFACLSRADMARLAMVATCVYLSDGTYFIRSLNI